MTTSWTKLSDNAASWTGVPKAASAITTVNIVPGNPIGLLLALTYATASSYTTDTWTDITKAMGTAYTKVAKAT